MADNRGRKGGRVTQRATPPKAKGGSASGRSTSSASRANATATATRSAAADPEGGTSGLSPSTGFLDGLRALFGPGVGDAERERPWWGMGDMLLWFLIAQVAAAVAFLVAVSLGGYDLVHPTGPGAVVGEYTGQVAVGVPPSITKTGADLPIALQALLQVPLWLGFLGGPLYAAWRKGTSLKVDFGFTARWSDVPIGLAIGVAVQALFVPAFYWVLFKILGQEYDVSAQARELTDKATSPAGVVLLLLLVGVGAPVFEELFFRGLSQRAIAKRFGPIAGIVLAAFFFAFAHAQSLQFPALFMFGLLLGTIAYRTGRLGMAIFAHMGFNLTAAVTLVWNLPLP